MAGACQVPLRKAYRELCPRPVHTRDPYERFAWVEWESCKRRRAMLAAA